MRRFLSGIGLVLLASACLRADGSNPYIGQPRPAPGCHRPAYSPLHYWMPQLYRTTCYFQRPDARRYKVGIDPYPDVPATFKKYELPCRYTDPARLAPLYGQ